MSELTAAGSSLGTTLQTVLMCDEIQPGSESSYQVCKTIFEYHPLGAKMARYPVAVAMSQTREISVPKAPDSAKDAFLQEWKRIGADRTIMQVMTFARVYGVASLAMIAEGVPPSRPVDMKRLADLKIAFNVLDPLNTSGSLVLNQDPNAIDFQKPTAISVQGQAYHPSRTVTVMNEEPVYLGYTTSAFGYVGRSVYQRSLFPMKSFIQSTITDDLVVVKSGVLIAKMKQAGSIITQAMQAAFGLKRSIVKEAVTGNVVGIGTDETIESIDMKNLEGPFALARKNILENIATGADMPSILLNSETYAEGFGEGTEDAKAVAHYVDKLREAMQPLYEFFDRIVQRRAWDEDFYKTMQSLMPEDFGGKPYFQAFNEWQNSFSAVWPSLLTEPESEKVKSDDVKLKAIIAAVEVFAPMLDPENKASMVMWAQENMNGNKHMFGTPLALDIDALREYVPPTPVAAEGDKEPSEPKPFAASDSASRKLLSMRRT